MWRRVGRVSWSHVGRLSSRAVGAPRWVRAVHSGAAPRVSVWSAAPRFAVAGGDGGDDGHDVAGEEDDTGELSEVDFADIAAELRPGQVLPLPEEQLEESFVRGWGKGGQKVNKTNNAVILTHKPTGLQVKVHATRSLQQNRKIARKQLALKLDGEVRGTESVLSQKAAKKVKQNRKRYQRAKAKYGDGGSGQQQGGEPAMSAKQKRALRQAKKEQRKNR